MNIRARVPLIRIHCQPSQHTKRVIALATAMVFSMPLIAQNHKAAVNQYGNNAAGREALCPSNYTWAGDTRDRNGNILHHCVKDVTPMHVPSARSGDYEEIRGTNYPTSGVSNTADGSDLCVQQMMDLANQMRGLANDESNGAITTAAAAAQAQTLNAQIQSKWRECEPLLNEEQAKQTNAVTEPDDLASGRAGTSEETSVPPAPSPGSVAALDDSTNDLLPPTPKAIADSPTASTQDGGNNVNAGETANNPAQDAQEQTDEAAPTTSAITQDEKQYHEDTSVPPAPSPGSVAGLDAPNNDLLTPTPKPISPLAATQDGNDTSTAEAANNTAQDAQKQTFNETVPTTSATSLDPSSPANISSQSQHSSNTLTDAVAVASEGVVTQAASVQFEQSPRSLASEQASSNETQQWEPTEQQKNAFDTVMEEFRSSSQHVAEAIATLKNSGFAKAFVNFFSNAGEHIQPSFSGAVTDVGGPIISLGQGMLNPEVAKGTKSIYDQYKDPNHVSHGDQYCATGLFPEECPPAQAQPTPSTQGRGSAPQ